MADTIERIARMEGTVEGIQSTVSKIQGYMEHSALDRNMHHTLVIERLARIETSQATMQSDINKYQKDCNAVAERVDAVEKVQERAAGKATGIAAAVSSLMVAGGLIIDYFRRG